MFLAWGTRAIEDETAEQQQGKDPAARMPVSATEQLAQLTLDALPEYMKAPGGIARFQTWVVIIVTTAIVAFGIAFYQMG